MWEKAKVHVAVAEFGEHQRDIVKALQSQERFEVDYLLVDGDKNSMAAKPVGDLDIV